MRQLFSIDIHHYSFNEFVDFVFDRDVPTESEPPTTEERRQRWYSGMRAIFDPQAMSSHYVQLFTHSGSLLERFSRPQLEQGFGAIERACNFSVRRLIWNPDLDFSYREQCVRSMFFLFRDFFRIEPLGYTANMWRDGFCYDWEIGGLQRSRGGEDRAMQDVMFSTMEEILSIDSHECRNAALHGLSHLHHPATLELLRRWQPTIPVLQKLCDEYDTREMAWEERLKMRERTGFPQMPRKSL